MDRSASLRKRRAKNRYTDTAREVEDESVIGAMFYVMELARGRSYANGALPDFDPATRRRMYEQLIDTLADLHNIDPDAAALSDFGKAGNYFGRQVMRWTRQYRDSQTDYVAEMERLIAFLPETIPQQARTAIVHGDYRIDNVMFDGNLRTNEAHFDEPAWNHRLEAAARLSGEERYAAYARLDTDLARQAAPWIAFENDTRFDFFSSRIGCQTYQPIYGIDLATLCIRAPSSRK